MATASEPLYYRHSGHVGVVGPILMIVFGTVCAVVLGAIYGYLIAYNPFVYVNFFATMVYGGGCGVAVSVAAKIGKVRRAGFVVGAGFVLGVACVYTSWVSWIHAFSGDAQVIATDPQVMVRVVGEVARRGAWSIFGWMPTGAALYAIWAVEAAMIAGSAVFASFAYAGASDNTFCESCRKWTKDIYISPLLADIADPEAFARRLERGDYAPLTALARIEMVSPPNTYTRYTIQGCPKCEEFFCLDVKRVDVTLDDKDKRKEEETLLLDNLIVGRRVYDALNERYGDASEAIQ